VISGSIEASTIASPVFDRFHCYLRVDGAEVTGSRRTMMHTFDDNTVDIQGNVEENCATDGVVRVAAGSHNVVLAVQNNESSQFFGAVVWAIYVPFDSTGAVP
jgi:hypothetical protein